MLDNRLASAPYNVIGLFPSVARPLLVLLPCFVFAFRH